MVAGVLRCNLFFRFIASNAHKKRRYRVCCMWAPQLSFSETKTTNRKIVNNNNSSKKKRHLMDVRVKWAHIEAKVFCKLIRQFKTRCNCHTSCSQPYVDYREYSQQQGMNWKGKKKNKRAATDSLRALCQVTVVAEVAATCVCTRARVNWSSRIFRLWQLPVRQSTSTDLESNICPFKYATLEWLMNETEKKQRNKTEYWIKRVRSFCVHRQNRKKNKSQKQAAD